MERRKMAAAVRGARREGNGIGEGGERAAGIFMGWWRAMESVGERKPGKVATLGRPSKSRASGE